MRYDTAKITRRRTERGWSKGRLAELIDVDPKTITNIERGTGGKPETLKKIADVLGIRMQDLLIEDEQEVAS